MISQSPESLINQGFRGLFMDEEPEHKDISDKYFEERDKIEKYRSACKDEAIDMLKEYFYDLWD